MEKIAAFREQIRSAPVDPIGLLTLKEDARARNAHASTQLKGNSLTLRQVRALQKGRPLVTAEVQEQQEVLNHLAALEFIERNAGIHRVDPEEIGELHSILLRDTDEANQAGQCRTSGIDGADAPSSPREISDQIEALLKWWNGAATSLSPVLSAPILHHRFQKIRPFSIANGRMSRVLTLWEIYRRGFDVHRVFTVDEFYGENPERYTQALAEVSERDSDLRGWIEFWSEGLQQVLERAWLRLQTIAPSPKATARRKEK